MRVRGVSLSEYHNTTLMYSAEFQRKREQRVQPVIMWKRKTLILKKHFQTRFPTLVIHTHTVIHMGSNSPRLFIFHPFHVTFKSKN